MFFHKFQYHFAIKYYVKTKAAFQIIQKLKMLGVKYDPVYIW